MIEEIRIRGLGVIDTAVVEPHAGFTAVTGETGAGKTLLLTGLALLLGGRADAGVVRASVDRAEVEGRFRVDAQSTRVLDRVLDAGGDLDDGVLVIARTVAQEGRSRAFVGGRSVPASVLVELADDLVAVHGQSDQQRLLAPARQREALDRFASDAVSVPLADYRAAYERLRVAERELQEITTHVRERAQEADVLRHGLEEVDAVSPLPGEDVALALEARRLAYSESLRTAASTAHEALRADSDGTDALSLVAIARRTVDAQREHDPELGELADRLADAGAVLADISGDLASYAASVESDPVRLAALEERRARVGALQRKYGATVDDVLEWARAASLKLLELDGDDGRRDSLATEVTELRTDLARLATQLSEARAAAGSRFAADVTTELVELAMPHARLSVDLRRSEAADGLEVASAGGPRRFAFGPHGIDEVELLLAPHSGAPARPIAKGASGGELSRVMLAIEVVLAGTAPVPTLIFDEVDAGVGGRAAVEIGRRLARLARSSQVLVVTHLPQVAAFAERHVVVEKSDDGTVTTSGVRVVADDDRVRELARMLAGLEGSEAAAAHAQELLDLASSDRSVAVADRSSAPATRRRKART